MLCCCVMSVVYRCFLLLLLLFCFLSVFSCACWCALPSKRHGARSRVRDVSHRRQHCCAMIEDLACCGFNLRLAAFCSSVESGAVLCCAAAAAIRVACVCFHRGHQKRCFIATKCSRSLRTNNKVRTSKYVLGKKSVRVLIFRKAIYHVAGRYVQNKAFSCFTFKTR